MKGWDTVSEIKRLLDKGLTVSAVARRLGIDRKTVRKYRDLSMDEVADYRVRRSIRVKKIDGFRKFIDEKVEAMAAEGIINAQEVYHALRQTGYRGSPRSVRRAVARYRKKLSRARIYKPFETAPGAQALVDLGEKRKVWVAGQLRVVYFVVMILGHSRMKYVEWYDRPIDTETFLQFHERAFAQLGGVPHQVVYDQTKLAVMAMTYGEAELNEQFYRYVQWRRFKPFICNRFDPETKGKVEAAVRYIKRSFLLGKRFVNWVDLEAQWRTWVTGVANAKIHEVTGRSPHEAWLEERQFLMPFAEQAFEAKPAFRKQQAYKDGLVKVLGNRYSVPISHHRRQVKVRVTEATVEIYTTDDEHLWTHVRYQGKGGRFMEEAHYRREERTSRAVLAAKVSQLYGEQALVQRLQARFPRHFHEQCRGLLSLQEQYSHALLRQAAVRLLHHDCVSYRNMRRVLVYLESREDLVTEPLALTLEVQMPLDLGLEERPTDYYDQLAGVEV